MWRGGRRGRPARQFAGSEDENNPASAPSGVDAVDPVLRAEDEADALVAVARLVDM